MPVLILKDQSTKSPVQFVHHRPDQLSEQQKDTSFEVVVITEPPTVLSHQVTRLYSNYEEQTYWWETETKPSLTPSEFFSIIPQDVRKHLWVSDDLDLNDAIEIIKIEKEVDMNSEHVATVKKFINNVLEKDVGF